MVRNLDVHISYSLQSKTKHQRPYKERLTPRFYEVRKQLVAYIKEVILPNTHIYKDQAMKLQKKLKVSALRCPQPKIMEMFREEANKRGLWNLFLPEVSRLSVLEYAPIAEVCLLILIRK